MRQRNSKSDSEKAHDCRRLLYMVAELHAMGYEQLRIAPAEAPSGLFWRLSITSAENTRADHGAEMRNFNFGAHYSSGGGTRYFDWTDAAGDSATELAEKFVERFPEIAIAGKGRDPEYVRWFSEMLEATEPDGLVCVHVDWPIPRDRLSMFYGERDVEIPLPPQFAGPADEGRGKQ